MLTAGVSAPILTADKLDTKLDYDSIQAAGSMLGSASLIVLDEDTCIVRSAALMEEFFRHESCGKCTPCREGTSWLFKILTRIEAGPRRTGDLDLLLSLSGEISGKVLCALGDFATSPVVATVKQYRDEYERHIAEGDVRSRHGEVALTMRSCRRAFAIHARGLRPRRFRPTLATSLRTTVTQCQLTRPRRGVDRVPLGEVVA